MKNMTANQKFIHDFYGIFVDYLIDTNRDSLMDSHEYCYNTYKTMNIWEVVKIENDGRTFLALDIHILSFNYCKYVRLDKRVLKYNLNPCETFETIKAYSSMLGIPILDQFDYYMTRIPKSL